MQRHALQKCGRKSTRLGDNASWFQATCDCSNYDDGFCTQKMRPASQLTSAALMRKRGLNNAVQTLAMMFFNGDVDTTVDCVKLSKEHLTGPVLEGGQTVKRTTITTIVGVANSCESVFFAFISRVNGQFNETNDLEPNSQANRKRTEETSRCNFSNSFSAVSRWQYSQP